MKSPSPSHSSRAWSLRLRLVRYSSFVALGLWMGAVQPTVAHAAAVPSLERLAMVDLQRILEETRAGRRARAELETSAKTKQQQVDKQRSELEAEAAKLRNLTGKALADAQQKLQAESMEWQKKAYALEQSLAEEEGKLLEEIYGNTQRIVRKLAESEKLNMVLVKDQMTVIYAEPNLDLTSEVIKRYDKAHPN